MSVENHIRKQMIGLVKHEPMLVDCKGLSAGHSVNVIRTQTAKLKIEVEVTVTPKGNVFVKRV